MGTAKRRGTFEQRKAQRLSKQYGLTNEELDEAYRLNSRYKLWRILQDQPAAYRQLAALLGMFR